MKKAVRVLVLGGFADSLINFRGELLREFRRCGCEVIACAPDASDRVRHELGRMGVEYRHVPLARAGLDPRQDLASFRQLRRLFAEAKPDLFLGYTVKPVIYGSLAAARAGVPAIYSMITGLGSTFSANGMKGWLIRRLVIFLYRRALRHNARVFFQNPDDIALFRTMGILDSNEQAVQIPGSGVDVHQFRPAPFPQGLSFLLIARLLRQKGIAEYAEAARLVRQRHPHVRFRLAGWLDENPDSISAHELQAWVEEGTLEYLGRLDDVRSALADASVFVLPSYYREGIPRTLLEALAMGRPLITTDAPGCRLTVSDGENGYLVPVRDAHALAEAMERFIARPEMLARMGAASRCLAEQHFDVRIVNGLILEAMGLA